MTSFIEVRIHNPYARHVLVHVINIKASSTPLSLISLGLYVHTISPPFLPPLPSSAPYLDAILSFLYFVCARVGLHQEADVEKAFLALPPVHIRLSSLAKLVILDHSLATFLFQSQAFDL